MLRRGNIWRREEAMAFEVVTGRPVTLRWRKVGCVLGGDSRRNGVIGKCIEVVGRERPKSAIKRYAGRPRLTLLT